jgi:hypothetical protein
VSRNQTVGTLMESQGNQSHCHGPWIVSIATLECHLDGHGRGATRWIGNFPCRGLWGLEGSMWWTWMGARAWAY